MIRKLVSIAILCVLAISLPSYADVLVLNDGREYQGVVLSQDEKIVRFEAHHHGMRMTMNVPRSNIKSLQQVDPGGSASPEVASKDDAAIDERVESNSDTDDLGRDSADSVTTAPIEFQSSNHGYSLKVPAGWERIPDHIVRQAVNLLQDGQSDIRVEYEAAFQSATNHGWFQSAYVLVQVMPYKAFGSDRQPYENEINGIVQELSGLDLEQLVIDNATELGEMLLGDIETTAPTVDPKNRRLAWSQEQRFPDGTSDQMLAMGHIGKESLVGVYFYAPADEWDRHAMARSDLFRSFEFHPDYTYDETKANAPLQTATRDASNTASPLPHLRNDRDIRRVSTRGMIFFLAFLLVMVGKGIFNALVKPEDDSAVGHVNPAKGIKRG